MKALFTRTTRVIIIGLLLTLFTGYTFAQKQLGDKSVTDYTSIVKVTGTAEGINIKYTNPYSNNTQEAFAGTLNGAVNSLAKKFYCIDIRNLLEFNKDYWDEGNTSPQVTYILNNYFPLKTTYTGKLSDNNKEAAAVQAAIWYFSDNLNISTITDADVKTRANQIVADAIANNNNVQPLQSLLIIPLAQSFVQGTLATFDVYVLDQNGNPLSGKTVSLSTSLGTLSQYTGVSNASGKIGPITVSYSGIGTATIKAQATVEIPQGTKYVHKTSPNDKQKLVLATPGVDKKEVTATIEWYKPADCDLKGFTTYTQGGWSSPSNSGPGKIRDLYFSEVFPTGLVLGSTYKLTLTTATAVKNFLPQGSTAGAFTTNYTNPTTTSAGVLAGQLVALKLNVAYSAAGKIGSNPTKLGDLAIASGPFAGKTISQFLALAELAIGGGSLNGFSFSDFNDTATKINENFDNGTVDTGFLKCADNTLPKASLGDKVWNDANKNGIQDSGEAGIAGVAVKLFTCSGTLIATTNTDANGNYLFANIAPADYYAEFVKPTGFVFSPKDQGSDDSKDSDAEPANGKTICTTLTAGENDLTWDAGLYPEPKASLGDKVWEDLNKNGIQDANEPGMANVTVKLFDCSGALKSTTTTNTSGIYSFTNLNPGSYYVEFVSPSGYQFTIKNAGGSSVDSDADANGKTDCVTLNAGDNNTTVDAGLFKPELKASLGDKVWEDTNKDGIQDSNEFGVANVAVKLYTCSGDWVASTNTNIYGVYSFANLNAGSYFVEFVKPSGYLFTTKDAGTNDAVDSDVDITTGRTDCFTLNPGDNNTSIDAGIYKPEQKASLGDKVWEDFNKNGIQESNEPGIQNVTVKLYDCSNNNLVATTTTNSNGIYSFTNLNPGDYYVLFSLPTNYIFSHVNQGSNDNVDSDADPTTGKTSCITLAGGDNNTSVDAGMYKRESADLKIEKTVNNNTPNCGDNIIYTIKVTNSGPDNASNVEVTDVLPSGLIFQSSSTTQGSYNPTTGKWTVGTLSTGSFATLSITVKVDCNQVNNSMLDLGVAKDYNLFVIEDVNQPSSDTQGKVAVGRDAYFANYSMGDLLPPNSGYVLVVGNNLTYTSGRVYNGDVLYGNASNLPAPYVSVDGAVNKGTLIDFNLAKSHLENLSLSLSSYSVNGITTLQWGGLRLTGTDPYLNVFKVTGTDLSSANDFQVNVPNGSVVIVNINGTNVSWTGGHVVTGTAINNVLYNFYEAKNLKIQGIDIRGSILAPFAAVDFVSGVQNGQMICKSLTGMGQFNLAMFMGYIPVERKITNYGSISSSSAVDPNNSNNISSALITVGGTTGGSTGGTTGGSWTTVSSFATGEIVYAMLYDGSTIYAGTLGGKIYRSNDGGRNWTVINTGMNVSFIWSLTKNNGTIFAATEIGVFKYNGTNWTITSLAGKDVHALAVHNGIIYAGTWGLGVYKSSDNGTTWTAINNGLGAFLAVQSLTVHNGKVFAGTMGGGVFRTDDGTNWTKLTCGYNLIWALASTSNTLFAGSYGDGLYKSVDDGSSWVKVTSLNVPFVYSINVDGSGKIYVGSWTTGIHVSSDNGNTWSSLGLGGFGVSTLVVNPANNSVFAGTKEGKIYTISYKTTSVEENSLIPTEFKLSQNYPNPFNPTTTIEFAIPVAGKFSLKVFDILGQEVASLIDGELTSGIHKATFDASKLTSGMYIYRLSGNNVNISKKMLLTK